MRMPHTKWKGTRVLGTEYYPPEQVPVFQKPPTKMSSHPDVFIEVFLNIIRDDLFQGVSRALFELVDLWMRCL